MYFFNAAKELDLKHKPYRAFVKRYTLQLLQDDLGDQGDLTTRFFLKRPRQTVQARVTAKEEGVLAGLQEVKWLLQYNGIKLLKAMKEGAILRAGSPVMTMEGRARDILAVERTLLNLLQRMSGVATATKKLSLQLPNTIKLLATRKTLWGSLDKRAVTVGGGGTHRLNLGDAILIKENHLHLVDDLEAALLRVFKQRKKARFIEVEVETTEQAFQVQEIYEKYRHDHSLADRFAVMLDNFPLRDIARVVPRLRQAGILVELSGNINERNIKKYALKGVTAVSAGCITNKAVALDMSLEIL